MSIEALVFDMDGLMLDTEPLYKVAWQGAGRELGFEIDDHFYMSLIGRPTPDCAPLFAEKFSGQFPFDYFNKLWPQWWQKETARGIGLKPGLLELLELAQELDLLTAVATSSDLDYMQFSFERSGLAHRFDAVITGDLVASGKPAPDIYLAAAKTINVPPANCLAFEDSEVGVVAAKSAGMTTVLVPDVLAATERGKASADFLVASLHEARDIVLRGVSNIASL